MIQFLSDYGLFLAKTLTWVAALLATGAGFLVLIRAARAHRGPERLEIRNLNDRLQGMADALNADLLSESEFKQLHKQRQQEEKARRKAAKKGQETARPRLFVLNFHGDLQAHAADSLREEITALLQVARDGDEVLLRLESAGGLVHAYGLAASQLQRIRRRGLKLTVAIDKVAASGGYLMACVADHILAAPFAIVGSIGVIAQLPNFHRLLKKHDIDFELHTAGEFKRTLTVFGENTDAAREKFREELDETHDLFKAFVTGNRPQLDIGRVATGEHWYGSQAVELKLVDGIQTSDDYLLERKAAADLFELSYRRRPPLSERVAQGLVRLGLGLRRGLGSNTWQGS
ncbi:MAG TPA: protease SohB [Solimonas sp.]|nr:protease SohB [Solimonas sp.]